MSATISILIISYDRPGDLLELLQSIGRQTDKSSLKEILVLNNASSESYEEVEHYIQNHPELLINYSLSTENLGVSRGRNKLMSEAVGDWLLVLDDDILLINNDDLQKISRIPANPVFKDARTAVITLRVIYHSTKEQQQTALPHKNYEEYRYMANFLTWYYAGCAHLMKREVLSQTGLYPENFFYGMEEYDLSYRTIGAGYTIGYDASVTVEHKESPLGRQPNYQKLASQWLNKSIVAWRYLPKRYYLSTMIAWSWEYIRKSGGHWSTFFATWSKVIRIPFRERRKKPATGMMDYLKFVKARLWY